MLPASGEQNLRLGTNFKSDTRGGGLGIVDSLGAGLNVGTDAVVVAGREGVQVTETVEGDSVFGGVVTNGGGVTGDFAVANVVGGLSTDEKTVTAEDCVSGEG